MPSQTNYDPIKAGCSDGSGDYVHDKACLRAVQSRYRVDKKVVGDPERTIFVGRLNPLTSEATVRDYFNRFGDVKRCRLVKDIVTGMSRRYAFIEYKHCFSAKQAAECGHHAIIDSREIIVEMEFERLVSGWKPRRLGGGLGGSKKSGQLRFGGKETPFKRPAESASRSARHRPYLGKQLRRR